MGNKLLLPLAAGLLAVSGLPGLASQTVLRSKAPYWQVGVPDRDLSRACGLGRFGQIEQDRFIAEFVGPKGPNVLGIAKGSGLNLYDPGHLAKPAADYFFLNQGTADCQVFAAQKKPDTPASAAK